MNIRAISLPLTCAFLFTILMVFVSPGCSAPAAKPTGTPVTSTPPVSSSPAPPTPTSTGTTVPPAPTSTTAPVTSSPPVTPKAEPTPTTIFVPTAPPYKPAGAQLELFQYLLSLINKDRQGFGLPPVTLSFNAAAQKHAQDMFDNYYSSHWGTDGLKPYMRYTLEGGLNFEAENSAYSGWFNPADNPANHESIDVRQEIAEIERLMMYEDAGANWGHRDTILNKWAKRVSLGIVYDDKRVAFVEQFEGEYLEYYTPPTFPGVSFL